MLSSDETIQPLYTSYNYPQRFAVISCPVKLILLHTSKYAGRTAAGQRYSHAVVVSIKWFS